MSSKEDAKFDRNLQYVDIKPSYETVKQERRDEESYETKGNAKTLVRPIPVKPTAGYFQYRPKEESRRSSLSTTPWPNENPQLPIHYSPIHKRLSVQAGLKTEPFSDQRKSFSKQNIDFQEHVQANLLFNNWQPSLELRNKVSAELQWSKHMLDIAPEVKELERNESMDNLRHAVEFSHQHPRSLSSSTHPRHLSTSLSPSHYPFSRSYKRYTNMHGSPFYGKKNQKKNSSSSIPQEAGIFSFTPADIQAYNHETYLPKNNSHRRCYSETVPLKEKQRRDLASYDARFTNPPRYQADSKKVVRMVELRKPTLEELRSLTSYKTINHDLGNNRIHASTQSASGTRTRYIELKRPEKGERNESYHPLPDNRVESNTSVFRTMRNGNSRDKHQFGGKSIREKTFAKVKEADEVQTEPLNLSCGRHKQKQDEDTNRNCSNCDISAMPLNYSVDKDHRNTLSIAAEPPPLRSPSKSFLSTLSPLRNLRLSDSTSPVPPSPSRKRQGALRDAISTSSIDLVLKESVYSMDDLENGVSIFPKLGRFQCKSETNLKYDQATRKSPVATVPDLKERITKSPHYNFKNRIKEESLSLPSSPNHLMPAKWRYKRMHKEYKAEYHHLPGSTSDSVLSEDERSPQQFYPPNDINFSTSDFSQTTENHAIKAYQNEDRLVIITDEVDHHDLVEMEVEINDEMTFSSLLEDKEEPFIDNKKTNDLQDSREKEELETKTKISNVSRIANETIIDMDVNDIKSNHTNVDEESIQELFRDEPEKISNDTTSTTIPEIELRFNKTGNEKQCSSMDVEAERRDLIATKGLLIKAFFSMQRKSNSCPSTPSNGQHLNNDAPIIRANSGGTTVTCSAKTF